MSATDNLRAAVEKAELEEKSRCITEGCGKERLWNDKIRDAKGLCPSCYGQARRLIDSGEASWDSLEAMGLVIQDDTPFMAAFKRKRAAQTKTEE